MADLPKKYDHKLAEKKWQQIWEESGVYSWDKGEKRENSFVIDTPPPTVSGLLHMGHVFSYTQADFVARYMRMSGKNVFYPMGFDDNGLPTERLVEKSKKVRAVDMSREEFISLCESVSEEARGEFRRLFESIALSVDWQQEYHTISEKSRKISQLSFLDLFQKERIYRKLQPMFWDPIDQTAIAQAEVEDKELNSHFSDVRFSLNAEGTEHVVIGTTRPELIAACSALFFHPEDNRYQHLQGKKAFSPLFGAEVPILADDTVKMDKGTGLVMCCTFGDEMDIEWWRKHDLPTRIILNKYGKICNLEGLGDKHVQTGQVWPSCKSGEEIKKYSDQITGLKVVNAREKMLQLLEESGDLLKKEPITHTVKCAERSGSPLEILPTKQWFVKILDQKQQLKDKAEECNWYPHFMKTRVDQWIDGLSWDWCISRQRYFGVPFPIWYSKRQGEEGKVLLANPSQLPVNPLVDLPEGYSADEVEPEADVMDTWATSSVSPQLSSMAITDELSIDEQRHKKLFPADLRPQAHEIIRTWAFYTIVKAHLHEDTVPWKNLMISGWCLARDKTKMSKSKGNVVTPVALIEEKGADVVRFWASTSRLGSDTAYSEDVLKIGKKLVNKLWNATKFAAIHLDKLKQEPASPVQDISNNIITEQADLWILTRLKKAIVRSTAEFEKFEYCNARVAIEDFFWNDFCDNYLELVKVRAYGEADGISEEARQSAIHTIYHCLKAILKLFAPFVPHITEELYSSIFAEDEKLLSSRGSWPDHTDYPSDDRAENSGIACVSVLNAVRKMKAERNVSIKWPLDFLLVEGENAEDIIGSMSVDLANVANASSVSFSGNCDNSQDVISENTEGDGFTVTAKFSQNSSA